MGSGGKLKKSPKMFQTLASARKTLGNLVMEGNRLRKMAELTGLALFSRAHNVSTGFESLESTN